MSKEKSTHEILNMNVQWTRFLKPMTLYNNVKINHSIEPSDPTNGPIVRPIIAPMLFTI